MIRPVPVGYQIEAHDDESVTVRVGSITARIRGDGFRDANAVAHVVAQHVAGTYELADLRTRLATLRDLMARVERSLRTTELDVGDLVAYAKETTDG